MVCQRVVAAHPHEPNQFAVGVTNGGVVVLEPLELEGKWGVAPPTESGLAPISISVHATSTTPVAACSDQVPQP